MANIATNPYAMLPYAKIKKFHFLLPAGILLLAISAVLSGIFKIDKRHKKKEYLDNPQTGDVYLVKEKKNKETSYYFLKVAELWEDSIIVYHSSLEYSSAVKVLDKEEYFELDEQLIFTKNQLQQMFEQDELRKVEKDYSSNESFNRMKYE